jgi:hypothetical protein
LKRFFRKPISIFGDHRNYSIHLAKTKELGPRTTYLRLKSGKFLKSRLRKAAKHCFGWALTE